MAQVGDLVRVVSYPPNSFDTYGTHDDDINYWKLAVDRYIDSNQIYEVEKIDARASGPDTAGWVVLKGQLYLVDPTWIEVVFTV